MTASAHTMSAPGGAGRRFWGLFFAILLQAGLIYALVEGLNLKVWPKPTVEPFQVTLPQSGHPQPPPNTMTEPVPLRPIVPVFQIENSGDEATRITLPQAQSGGAIAFQAAQSIAATHTKPPYPPIEQRLGITGAVQLRLTISAEGAVTGAEVTRSSGSAGLDRAAQTWVLAHWRYRPALRGGAAVASTTQVLIRFDLENER
jgi:periplasmic protein TonB